MKMRAYLMVRLVVEYDSDEASEADVADFADRVLDNGTFQDVLTEYADDLHNVTLEVVQADLVDSDLDTDAIDEIPLLAIDGTEGACETEIVWDALGAVIHDDTRPQSDEMHDWTEEQLVEAYDWAIREACTDGSMQKRPRPPHTIAASDTDTDSHRGHKGICGTVTCRAMEDT